MSRERKEVRDRRRAASGSAWLQGLVNRFAASENRELNSGQERERYLQELRDRGVIVDQGDHPSGRGRKISLRFDQLNSGSGGPVFNSLESLLETIGSLTGGNRDEQ